MHDCRIGFSSGFEADVGREEEKTLERTTYLSQGLSDTHHSAAAG